MTIAELKVKYPQHALFIDKLEESLSEEMGEFAFKMTDTHGIPPEITLEYLNEHSKEIRTGWMLKNGKTTAGECYS